MAVIKCPECGHQVSEKAPTCPGCGVEIAGKIVRCPDCGEVYFKELTVCPACHRPTEVYENGTHFTRIPQSPSSNVHEQNQTTSDSQSKQGDKPKKKSYSALILSFLFAVVVCGVCYYYYNDAKNQKEREDYEYAMASSDPMVLQAYLDHYKDAEPAHRDSIQAHLSKIKQIDEDWTNAVVSGTREAIEEYLKNHPASSHKGEAMNKLDSMDFVVAQKDSSLDSYNAYIEKHPDGKYADQAKNEIDVIKSKMVLPEEELIVKGLFKHFFQSVNSRNEDGMLATVADKLISFLGHSSAGKSDVVQFLQRIYKSDITNMNWHILDDYKIEKRVIGQGESEFLVKFTAEQNIDRLDASQPKYNKYVISATVNADGKISEFNMNKVSE